MNRTNEGGRTLEGWDNANPAHRPPPDDNYWCCGECHPWFCGECGGYHCNWFDLKGQCPRKRLLVVTPKP